MIGEVVRAGPGLWSGAPNGPFQIHVKPDPQDDCGIIFSVDDGTWIGDSRRGPAVRSGIDILLEGARVEVWFDFVADSCPQQSRAEAVSRIE